MKKKIERCESLVVKKISFVNEGGEQYAIRNEECQLSVELPAFTLKSMEIIANIRL